MATGTGPELQPKSSQTLNYIDSNSHLDLSDKVNLDSKVLIVGGGYSDVFWKARSSLAGESPKAIAIKQLRFYPDTDIKLFFERETYVWAALRHPNVLPLLGFALDNSDTHSLSQNG